VSQYFPREVQTKFPDSIALHRLRREIISTALANAVVNRCGPACIVRLMDQTGTDTATIALAYIAVDKTYGLTQLTDAIDGLDNKIASQLQLDLYASVQNLLMSRMVWCVHNVDFSAGLEAVISRFGAGIREIATGLDNTLPSGTQGERLERRRHLNDAGVLGELARDLADFDALVCAPDIVLVADRAGRTIGDTAATFFAAEASLRLDRIVVAARGVPANDHFERLAIDRSVDQIATAERGLVTAMLATGQCGQQAVESWLAAHPAAARIRHSIDEIAASGLTLAKLTVAANLLGDLARG
jgi:glutamate dehydrogenase